MSGEISSSPLTDLDNIENNLMRAEEQAKAEPHKYLYSGAVLFVLGNFYLTQVFISSTFCCASGGRTGKTRSPSRTSWWKKKWKTTRHLKARSPPRRWKWWNSPDRLTLSLIIIFANYIHGCPSSESGLRGQFIYSVIVLHLHAGLLLCHRHLLHPLQQDHAGVTRSQRKQASRRVPNRRIRESAPLCARRQGLSSPRILCHQI